MRAILCCFQPDASAVEIAPRRAQCCSSPCASGSSASRDARTDLVHKYPEAIEEIGVQANKPPHEPCIGDRSRRRSDRAANPAVEHAHRAADHLAADVDAVGAGLKEIVKQMHEQLDAE